MTTIFDAMTQAGFRMVKHTGDLGVEIETESLREYEYPRMKFWDAKPDGSLRHFGVEYVMSSPVSFGKEFDTALEEFRQKTSKIQFIENSISTSVHVHLNFLNKTFLQMANFLTAYILVENILIKFSGPDRLSNLFCLPFIDARENLTNAISLIKNVDQSKNRLQPFRLNQEQMKYASLNIASFVQRGSLEVRTFRGSTDIDLITKWCKILGSLVSYAENINNPMEVIEFYKANNLEIVDAIFGEHADSLRYDNLKEMIEGNKKENNSSNLWMAAYAASSVKDWSNFGVFVPAKKNAKASKNILNEISLELFADVFDNLTPMQKIVVIEAAETKGYGLNVVEEPEVRDEPEPIRPPEPMHRVVNPAAEIRWQEFVQNVGIGQDRGR